MRVVITRKLWTRGVETAGSMHCARGFLRSQSGLAEMPKALGTFVECDGITSPIAQHIIRVNDRWPEGLAREQKIADLFGKAGIDVEFV